MRFELTQVIDAPVDDVAASYASPELYESMGPTGKLGAPEVLGRTEIDGRVTLRIRYRFVGELSPAVTAVVDPARLTWVEESVHDLDGLSVSVTLRPDHYADRLRCTGTYHYRSRGERSERRISGDLRVKALLVAGTVERAIIAGLEEHLAAEVTAVERYLEG